MVTSPNVTIKVTSVKTYTLSINVSPKSGKIGDVFTFNGRLVEWEDSVVSRSAPPATVNLILDGVVVGSGTTDAIYGVVYIPWTSNKSGTLTFHLEAPAYSIESAGIQVNVGEAIPPELDLPVIGGIALAVVDAILVAYTVATQLVKG